MSGTELSEGSQRIAYPVLAFVLDISEETSLMIAEVNLDLGSADFKLALVAVLGRSFVKGALHTGQYDVKLCNDPQLTRSSVPYSQILQVFLSSIN